MNYIIAMKFDISSLIEETNILQLGFDKETIYPGLHLLIKCGFSITFFITSRLTFQEKQEEELKKVMTFEEKVRIVMRRKGEKSRKSVRFNYPGQLSIFFKLKFSPFLIF